MTENIMQCCYTNAVQEIGGKISSGWQPVAVSDNIPSEAYNGCVSLQNANSTIQSHMVDERGNVLNLYEITGDGSFVYVSRTQYGLVDRLGRPNMFSHAYIFSWKREDVVGDPNTFLTIDKSNFADNEESAKIEKSNLNRNAAFTLERAMSVAGLTQSTYLTLIQCVYSQFSERKAAKPLFVNYDGSEEQMQAILYCIYYGLPHYVRKSLSIASAVSNTSDSKNIIFSEFASKHETYIIPQTGENNLLTQRTERKIARFGFVDYAARNCASLDAKQYFAQLDKLAMEFGDPTASNELVLKIAHQMIEGFKLSDLSEEELDSRLSDALRSKTYGSQRMEDYISDMLDEVRSRKMFLTEESEANLADRLAAPTTARLADAGEQYNIYRFSTLSVEEAAKMLTHMSSSIFARYSQTLAKSTKGLQILDHYYAEYSLVGREVTWEALSSLLDETSFMTSRLKTTDLIDAKAWERYYSLVEKKGEAVKAYDSLMALMGKLYGVGNQYQYEQAAREAYWERKSFDDFAYEDLSEYKAMTVSSLKCNMFAHMYQVMDVFKNNGEDPFLEYLNAFCRKFKTQIDEGKLTDVILQAIERELRVFCMNPSYLSKWMKVAALADAEELLKEILVIKKSIRARDYGTFISTYLKVIGASSFSRNSASLMKAVSTTICEECTKMDNEYEPIPLDVWMLLGSSQYANSFELFDTLSPAPQIFQINETLVVMQSKLLTRQPYSAQAEAYAQSKGVESKTVRKWLNELKAVEKRKKAEEKKARSESEGRGFGFFSGNSSERVMSRSGNDKADQARGSKQIPRGFEEQDPEETSTRTVRKTAFDFDSEDDSTMVNAPKRNTASSVPQRPTQADRKAPVRTPPAPKKPENRGESKQPEKKGFFKDLFGRK